MTEPNFSRKLEYKQTSLSAKRSLLERHRNVVNIRKDERDRIFSLRRQCDIPSCATESEQLDENQIASEISGLLDMVGSREEIHKKDEVLKKLRAIRFSMGNSERLIARTLQCGFKMILQRGLRCSNQEIVSEIICCMATIAAGSREQCSEMLDFVIFLLDRYEKSTEAVQKEAAIALGNISVNFPDTVIGIGAISAISKVLQNFVDLSDKNEAKSCAFLRISLWLLCNIFRSLDHQTSNAKVDISIGLLICSLLQGIPVSIVNLSSKSEWREIVDESLWCLTYLLPFQTCFIERCRESGIMMTIAHLVIEISTLSLSFPSNLAPVSSWINSMKTDLGKSTSTSPVASGSYNIYGSLESLSSDADLLFPSLKILNILCGDYEDSSSAPYIDALVGKPHFFESLSYLTQHKHRGVILESVCLVNRLLEGNFHVIEMAFPIFPNFVGILKSAANVDIKRQVALFFLSVISTNKHMYMEKLLLVQPNVALGMLNALESCCRDKELVLISLEFLEIVLEFAPLYRRYLYENRAIEILEAAQFKHDSRIERRIAYLVETYFDDDEDVSDYQNTFV